MNSKPWYLSKSIWGSLIVVAATITQMFGIDIGDPTGWLEPMMVLNGAILALYGRVKAVKKIGK